MSNQPGVRDGDEVLRVEDARFQEGHWNRRLESRLARTCRVRNNRDERSVGILSRHTHDDRGPDFGRMPRSTSQTSPRRARLIQSTRADRARQTADRRRREDPRLVAGHAATRLHDGQAPPVLRSVLAPEARRIARSVFWQPGSCHQRPTMLGFGQEAALAVTALVGRKLRRHRGRWQVWPRQRAGHQTGGDPQWWMTWKRSASRRESCLEARLDRLQASGYLPIFEKMIRSMCAPFWWSSRSPNDPLAVVRQNGTICFVNTGERC